jgi:hypothetical protein
MFGLFSNYLLMWVFVGTVARLVSATIQYIFIIIFNIVFYLKSLIYISFVFSGHVLVSMMILFVCPAHTICNDKCSFDKWTCLNATTCFYESICCGIINFSTLLKQIILSLSLYTNFLFFQGVLHPSQHIRQQSVFFTLDIWTGNKQNSFVIVPLSRWYSRFARWSINCNGTFVLCSGSPSILTH